MIKLRYKVPREGVSAEAETPGEQPQSADSKLNLNVHNKASISFTDKIRVCVRISVASSTKYS